jgi:hypothetical protein
LSGASFETFPKNWEQYFNSDNIALRDWIRKEAISQVLQEKAELYCLLSHDTLSPGGSHDGHRKIVTAINCSLDGVRGQA